MLKKQIEDDLKSAMLSGDSKSVNTLKMLKAAILNQEVSLGVRDAGLNDDQVTEVLLKESKRRLEASKMFAEGGRQDQADSEMAEHELIKKYLPEQMSDEDIDKLVTDVISNMGEVRIKDMGRVIGEVKAKAGVSADGAKIASIVKQKLSQ